MTKNEVELGVGSGEFRNRKIYAYIYLYLYICVFMHTDIYVDVYIKYTHLPMFGGVNIVNVCTFLVDICFAYCKRSYRLIP